MTEPWSSRVFSIPAGIPFLKTLAAAIMDGTLVTGFSYDPTEPLSLAKATIYVPTRRAARVLRSEFVDLIGATSAILPTISPLGETDDDSGYFDAEIGDSLDLLPPISSLERMIELARLILAWRNTLPQMLLDLHSGSPLVAPASPADALWLARSLAELIDSVETEERQWSELEAIDSADHALWWQLTAQFLKIASVYWPSRLAELHRSSPASHRNQLIRNQGQRILNGQAEGPVIVAGSTGSLPATADLIAAIRQYRHGAVVLPGLDCQMSNEDFELAGGMAADGTLNASPSSRSHPQYGLCHLLKRLDIGRTDVHQLAEADPAIKFRMSALSVAMAPSEATSNWTQWRLDRSEAEFQAGFADVALVEAANEQAEATAIAIAMKLAVSDQDADADTQVALVTPDRNLARRVGLELARFGIEADDSAGTPLLSSPQGSLTHLALEAILRPGDPVALTGLLKHPLVRLGLDGETLVSAVNALELIALRGGMGEADISMLAALVEEALSKQATGRHTPQWLAALPEHAKNRAIDIADRIAAAVEPLASALVTMSGPGGTASTGHLLSDWAERTGRVLEALAIDERGSLAGLWGDEAGDGLAGLLKGLIDSKSGLEANAPQWADVLTALMAGEGVKPKAIGHPRIFIWGTLEARLQSVDTLILGGLNEGVWPGQSANNPFLSRMMKTTIGLEPPERRIGQSAHDFMMAAGTRRLILTRALRQGATPTVASRFLQRSLAIIGSPVAHEMRERGRRTLQMAELIDQGTISQPATRPEPRPPAELQPVKYSFSEVSRLRRDPYEIYAKRILKLDPIAPFNSDPGAAERGTLYHAVVDQFIRDGHVAGTPAALAAMNEIAGRLFDEACLPDHVDAVWRPRFFEVAKSFLAFEAARQGLHAQTFTEVSARYDIVPDRLTLTGIADRIGIRPDGTADIIDYKTGLNPSLAQARALLDPQLALEAAALAAGAFKQVGPRQTGDLIYVRLKPGNGFDWQKVNNGNAAKPDDPKKVSAMQLAEDAIGELTKLVTDLKSGKYGFISRLIPAKQRDYGGDYDHLARVAEWTTATDDAEDGDE